MDPGRRLGHYEIQARLGAGGMGTVYQALDTRLNRAVALKVLSPDKWEGTSGRGRLMREAQAASALNHPNIVTVYEIGQERASISSPWSASRARRSPASRAGRRCARPCNRHPDRRCTRRGARGRHRASRPQARQHHGDRSWLGEDPRFRYRQSRRRRRFRIQRHTDPHPGWSRGRAPWPTCRPNRPRAKTWIGVPISSPSAACSTKW